MIQIPTPYNFELIVLEKDEKPYESEGRYFIDGPYNIVKTEMIEVTPLDQLTELQAKGLNLYEQPEGLNLPFVKKQVFEALKKQGLTLRVGERPEVVNCVCNGNHQNCTQECMETLPDALDWDSAIPQSRILLKLK